MNFPKKKICHPRGGGSVSIIQRVSIVEVNRGFPFSIKLFVILAKAGIYFFLYCSSRRYGRDPL